jgi:hypothetical protein
MTEVPEAISDAIHTSIYEQAAVRIGGFGMLREVFHKILMPSNLAALRQTYILGTKAAAIDRMRAVDRDRK